MGAKMKKTAAVRLRSRDEEHRLQVACVRWFRMQYPEYAALLFAVPNGGRRDAVTGARLRDEGVTAGVSDLLLLRPAVHVSENEFLGCWNGLCIELKTPTGRQSASQKAWQKAVEEQYYRYEVVRSLDEFTALMNAYMAAPSIKGVLDS